MLNSKWFMIFGFLAGLLLVTACGPEPIWVRPGLDTPSRHVAIGHQLLERNKLDGAYREFMRATELGPNYLEAYVGLGLTWAHKGDFQKGMEAMDHARALAVSDEDHAHVEQGVQQLKGMQAGLSGPK